MAIYPVSLLLALSFLLPALAERFDWQVPLLWLLSIPATGLGYMGTFFHEIGHTVFRWLFGYPAIPTFDLQSGGGMTYDFERSYLLLALVYGLAAALAFGLWKAENRAGLFFLLIAVLAHLALAFNLGHEVLYLYMGHGTEIAIGAFFLLRGIIGHKEFGAGERWLNLIFGFFIIAQNMLLSYGLMKDEVSRIVYEGQKGGHGFGDFSRIADILGTKLENVAAFSFLFALCFLMLAVVLGLREKRLD